MKNFLAGIIALVFALLVFVPVAKWDYARAKRRGAVRWHIYNKCCTTTLQDFWTTNPNYVAVVWETNGVTVTSRIVTNQYK